MSTPKPINHSARSVGQSPFDPQGTPLSTRKRWGLPHREKTTRNVACTVAGSTVFQKPWGENRGLQDRPAAFIHQPQPTHSLAAAQTQLVDGVHLPDFVRVT